MDELKDGKDGEDGKDGKDGENGKEDTALRETPGREFQTSTFLQKKTAIANAIRPINFITINQVD